MWNTQTQQKKYDAQTQSSAAIIKLKNKNKRSKTMPFPPRDNDSVHVCAKSVAAPQWLTGSEAGGNVAGPLVGGIPYVPTRVFMCERVSWLCRSNCGEVEKAEPQGQGGVAHQI